MHVQVVSEICMVKGRIYCGTRKFDTIIMVSESLSGMLIAINIHV